MFILNFFGSSYSPCEFSNVRCPMLLQTTRFQESLPKPHSNSIIFHNTDVVVGPKHVYSKSVKEPMTMSMTLSLTEVESCNTRMCYLMWFLFWVTMELQHITFFVFLWVYSVYCILSIVYSECEKFHQNNMHSHLNSVLFRWHCSRKYWWFLREMYQNKWGFYCLGECISIMCMVTVYFVKWLSIKP